MNRCVRLHGKKDIRVEDVSIPEPGPQDVLLRVAFNGICGSDVHFYENGSVEKWVLTGPLTLGHELSGVVDKVGSQVQSLQPGDRVAIDNVRPCFQCRNCENHRYNICSQVQLAGIPQTDGGCARYMVAPAYNCHRLPEEVSLQAGAVMEPLSVVVHGLRRSKVNEGDLVVVIGAGPIGLLALQAVKAMGARKVLVADINSLRLELAVKLGADLVFDSSGFPDPRAAAAAMKERLGSEADLAVECSGAAGTVDTAIFVCRVGGRILMLGIGAMSCQVHIGTAALREIDIFGCICNSNNFPEAIQLVASGKVNVLPIISHVFPLERFLDGLLLVRNGKTSVKVMIDCQA